MSGCNPLADQIWSGYVSLMHITTVTQAKATLSQLLVAVENGEEVVIGRAGRPVARLVPFTLAAKKRQFGTLKGKIWIAPDFDEWPEADERALGIID
jgi:prevent-host-death family protein